MMAAGSAKVDALLQLGLSIPDALELSSQIALAGPR
jgi:hypothetical protein